MHIHLINPCAGEVLTHLSVFSCITVIHVYVSDTCHVYSEVFPSVPAIPLLMKELVSLKGNTRGWPLYQYQQKSKLHLRCQH